MAVIDLARAALRLSGDELAAALLLAGDPTDPGLRHPRLDAARRDLVAAGAVADDGRLAPDVAGVMEVVRRPQLRLVLEIERAGAVVGHAAWATPADAVVGRTVAGGDTEYTACDPVSLPLVVAGLVGLGRLPAAGRRPAPLTTTVGELDRLVAVARDEPLGGTGAGAARPSRPGRALAALVAHRRHSWRAWSRFMDDAGAVVDADLTVVDAGCLGLWRCQAGPAGVGVGAVPDPRTVLTLTPIGPGEVWRSVLGLFPWDGVAPGRP